MLLAVKEKDIERNTIAGENAELQEEILIYKSLLDGLTSGMTGEMGSEFGSEIDTETSIGSELVASLAESDIESAKEFIAEQPIIVGPNSDRSVRIAKPGIYSVIRK